MAGLCRLMPESLEEAVMFRSDEFTSFETLFDRLSSYATARHSLQLSKRDLTSGGGSKPKRDPDAMDVSAVSKGKGKGKGKFLGPSSGAGKGSHANKMTCHNCGRAGHKASDCRAPRGDGKGKGKANQRLDNVQCWQCYGYGHYGKNCPSNKGKGKNQKGKQQGKNNAKGKGGQVSAVDSTHQPEKEPELSHLDLCVVDHAERHTFIGADGHEYVQVTPDPEPRGRGHGRGHHRGRGGARHSGGAHRDERGWRTSWDRRDGGDRRPSEPAGVPAPRSPDHPPPDRSGGVHAGGVEPGGASASSRPSIGHGPVPTSEESVSLFRRRAADGVEDSGPANEASRSRDRSRSRHAEGDDAATSVRDEDVDHNSMNTEMDDSLPAYYVDYGGEQWLKMNYDSGAVSTVIPVEMAASQGVALRRVGDYRVANGERIPRYGRVRVPCYDEHGLRRGFSATVTHVHKPLGSAGEFSATHDAYIFNDGGFLIPKDSEFAAEVRGAIERAKTRHGTDEMLTLHKEGNLYNLYLKQRADMQDVNALDSGSDSPSPNERQGDP
eukprot:s153_g51.t1